MKIALLTLTFKYHAMLTDHRIDYLFDASPDGAHVPPEIMGRLHKNGTKTFRIPNKGFNQNWHYAIHVARTQDPTITHVMLQNSDISYNLGEISYALNQISPDTHIATFPYNSVFGFLHPTSKEKEVPFIEFTAPIISLDVWDKMDGTDITAPNGWGSDVAFCVEARKRFGTPSQLLHISGNGKGQFTFHHKDGSPSTEGQDRKLNVIKSDIWLQTKLGTQWREPVKRAFPNCKF